MSNHLTRRYHRLFASDARSVTIAMDHGGTLGALAGFENAEKVLEQVIAGGADAILTTAGIARKFGQHLSHVGLMIRCDGATSPLFESSREQIVEVETLLELSADAAAAMYFPGLERDRNTTIYFPFLAEKAHRWNIPIMAEALPYGFDPHPASHAVEAVASACRMAVENGADIIKTFYTGKREGFKHVIETSFAPVLVLGGPRVKNDEEFFALLREAMDAGASGVVIGRNVWQAPSPQAMTRALVAIVHHDASVADALRILNESV
ncbi:fructose-bisphosphate aldolase [Ktedonosporobacter rubrisoli]|uniref:Fructose-bisphosphate aldolase n=1 Tax=Ktedonosporobacter rubrisoli TaxID=2509675 RepID=A0A4P6K0N1_KTERU|nr:fructose-bisphosphate aldolase [Ktedonosporobacter rubrisoli]QBD81697.1 fructose-bisphosphate aldolase [Ktedonosporobacter rubrisoli]